MDTSPQVLASDYSSRAPDAVLDGGRLAAGSGLLLLLRNAMDRLRPGQLLELRSVEPSAQEDIEAWCRLSLHRLVANIGTNGQHRCLIEKGQGAAQRPQPDWGVRLPFRPGGAVDVRDWAAGRAGHVPELAPASAGFVPRGAVAEPGMPSYPYTLNRKEDVWAPNLPQLYEQGKVQQWNAATDILWSELRPLPQDLERAVCQLMTFLAENEYSALYIPAKFLPRVNAQFVEVVLFLSAVMNDEARHIEAFTKRALANGGGLQYASALTEWSLHSLFIQEDYLRSSFLLHVLGEGTFLDLLSFIERYAPDPVTADVVRRARNDEGRHVAYGVAHVRECLRRQPARASELLAAAEERSAALQAAGDSNPAVTEALALLAGGGAQSHQLAAGFEAVQDMHRAMHERRVQHMLQIGLDDATANKISELHTPNFM